MVTSTTDAPLQLSSGVDWRTLDRVEQVQRYGSEARRVEARAARGRWQ
jgi:hypothetical protein